MEAMNTAAGQRHPAGGRFGKSERSIAHESRHRLPPFAKALTLPAKNTCLWIYTGKDAWNKAKRHGIAGEYVVLPPSDDPALYRWDFVRGSDALILGFGKPETLDTIACLGGLLHLAGASLVVYAPERGPVTRIDAARRHS